MDRPRAGSDASKSSMAARFKNCIRRFLSNTEVDKEDSDVDIRPCNARIRRGQQNRMPDTRVKYRSINHEYDTNHKSRGKVYIFNHLKFKKVPTREGTMKDVERLREALPKLGFNPKDIILFQDCNLCEIEEHLDEISKENHSDSDMLTIFILTHGQKDGKLYAYDRDYSIQEVLDHFTANKCTTLTGKPKIFFIIACRGDKMDDGAIIQQTRKASVTEIDAIRCTTTVLYRIPIWSDFLTIYSTADGYFSYRHPSEGTWYVQSFCNELKNFSEPYMHFIDFLTKVNENVGRTYQTLFDDPQYDNKKQCPFITSSLTKVINLRIASNETKTDGEVKHKPRPKSLNT